MSSCGCNRSSIVVFPIEVCKLRRLADDSIHCIESAEVREDVEDEDEWVCCTRGSPRGYGGPTIALQLSRCR